MKSFVFIIAARNNGKWIEKCLKSIDMQTYQNKRIIYIDDRSTEGIKFPKINTKMDIIKNDRRYGPAYSRWVGLKRVKKDEIVVFLDGDDWLSYKQVLEYLNQYYSKFKETKWAISNYREFKNNRTGLIPLINKIPININNFSKTHLRSGYGYVWKDMPESWIKYEGEYLSFMTDSNENLWALNKYGQPTHLTGVLMIYNCDSSKTMNEHKQTEKDKIKSYIINKLISNNNNNVHLD